MELRKITFLDEQMPECIALDIAPEQKKFLTTNAIWLAWAYELDSRGEVMECRAVYVEGKMIGLISYNYFVNDVVYKETCYRIRPIMIDKNYLGKGYEKVAIEKLLEEIKTKPHGEAAAVFATYDPDEAEMAAIYKEVGFVLTDLTFYEEGPDVDDVILRMGIVT